jgi:hypothetical protein
MLPALALSVCRAAELRQPFPALSSAVPGAPQRAGGLRALPGWILSCIINISIFLSYLGSARLPGNCYPAKRRSALPPAAESPLAGQGVHLFPRQPGSQAAWLPRLPGWEESRTPQPEQERYPVELGPT